MSLQETRCRYMDCIHLAKDRVFSLWL